MQHKKGRGTKPNAVDTIELRVKFMIFPKLIEGASFDSTLLENL